MKQHRLPLLLALSALTLFVRLSAAEAQSITRGPYLQRGYKSFMIVKWTTSTSTNSEVKVGTSPGAETLTFTAASGTDHRVELSGLQPATKYFYKVVSGGTTLAGGDTSHYFVTSPNDGDEPFNVWALGDSGISGPMASGVHPDQAAVRDSFLNVTPLEDLSFLVHLGDIAYNSGTDTQFQKGVFNVYPSILRALTLWPTQGNHDYTANAYYSVFSLPRYGEAGGVSSNTEYYYSWDHGNAHFISLNSEQDDPTIRADMITWLNQDLAATSKTWTIVFFHHPPYTKGSHDSDNGADSGGRMGWMRSNIIEILEDRGVDLVLSGHSHGYERSFFLDGHYGISSTFTSGHKKSLGSGKDDLGEAYTKSTLAPLPNGGTVYVVAGSGGQLSTGVPLNHPAMYTSQAVLGSLHLAFNANELTVRLITGTATIGDYFTIRKGSALPGTPSAFDVGAATTSCGLPLTWTSASSATSYAIYRANNRQSRGSVIAENVSSTSFTDPAPTPGVTHYYSVRGVNSNGAGPWSLLDSGIVAASDRDGDGASDCVDGCPDDSALTTPGECGCGGNIDTDADGTLNCKDVCPSDPRATTSAPACGCGKSPLGEFGDGTPNCSSKLSENTSPQKPLVSPSKRKIRIVMDSYSKQDVSSYTVVITSKGRVVKRFSTKKSSTTVRLTSGAVARVRYYISFRNDSRRRTTKWSRFTDVTVP
jgi:Calcineurin-like phosphoesterase/Purple acid Phosphatase, N-terminal domain